MGFRSRIDGNGKAPRRYVVCRNPEQPARDAATRAELLAALEGKLRGGAKSLIANKRCRRYLKAGKGTLSIDREKVRKEERFTACGCYAPTPRSPPPRSP